MSAILSVRNVTKNYPSGKNIVHAVDGVSFDIALGETVGLVGESGCGKSTLASLIMRLVEPTGGTILIDGADIFALRGRALRRQRSKFQIVFQNPYGSLNPRLTVGRILREPLMVNGIGTAAEQDRRVSKLLDLVGLSEAARHRFPHEFSGGQRQRIAIARAIALNPKLIVCDEPVSALDVSVRAQIMNLLLDLQQEFGIAYLFISHDLATVEVISQRVAVMYRGRIVEFACREDIWTTPLHPYTQSLINAIPIPNRAYARAHPLVAQDDPVEDASVVQGCQFAPRCQFARDRCWSERPELRPVGPRREVACHLTKEIAEVAMLSATLGAPAS